MAKKKVGKEVISNKTEDSKLFAFLATFLSIIGFLIAIFTKRDDKYVMFYAKQCLVVFIASVILSIIGGIFFVIPIMGFIIYPACQIITLVLWLLSWIYALSGEMKIVPIVGQFAAKFDF